MEGRIYGYLKTRCCTTGLFSPRGYFELLKVGDISTNYLQLSASGVRSIVSTQVADWEVCLGKIRKEKIKTPHVQQKKKKKKRPFESVLRQRVIFIIS